MKTKIAINGLGRIGRAFLKQVVQDPDYYDRLDIVAANDLGSSENLAYLLRYDTAYGRSNIEVKVEDGYLIANGFRIKFFQERDPMNLPWKDLDIDIVLESTGVFASYAKAKVHLAAGAKRVVISAPVKDNPEDSGVSGATILMGINNESLKTCQISSNASCTTNAVSPILEILNQSLGVKKALLNTVHGYTSSQSLIDSPTSKDPRRGRAAAQNIVPSSTGAAIAVTKAVTDLENLFDGIALRVPVITGSIVDLTFVSKKETSVDEVNRMLTEAAGQARWEGIFTVTSEPLVSSDIIGQKYGAIADLNFTRVVGGDLVKVLAWYDNEAGYTKTLADHILQAASFLLLSNG